MAMASNHNQRGFSKDLSVGSSPTRGDQIEVTFRIPADLASAVEGWRAANGLPSTGAALEALVRIGLLSEIAKSYQTVRSIQDSLD